MDFCLFEFSAALRTLREIKKGLTFFLISPPINPMADLMAQKSIYNLRPMFRCGSNESQKVARVGGK